MSAATATMLSQGKVILIYTGGLTLGRNLIIAAIVTKLLQRKGTLKYTHGLILGRSSFNVLSKINKYRKQCRNLEQGSLSLIQKCCVCFSIVSGSG